MFLSGINKEKNLGSAIKFMKASVKHLCDGAEKDGYGYAGITKNGSIFGERWLDYKKAFTKKGRKQQIIPKGEQFLIDQLGSTVDYTHQITYNSFGDIKNLNNSVAFILHSRQSTNEVNIENTHPFVDEEQTTALIHNGVIFNEWNYKDLLKSTCDSEILLHEYMMNHVYEAPEMIQEVVDQIDGYFSVPILTVDDERKPILDYFKSDAMLYVGWIEELQTLVFSTQKSTVYKTCQDLGWSTPRMFSINDNYFIRFDAITGETIDYWSYDYVKCKYGKHSKHQSNDQDQDWKNHEDVIDVNKIKEDWEKEQEDNRTIAEICAEDIKKRGVS
jgi:glucosamine 6-phosphate synthetase-like amidotransferase/phosphosugar isomerase protein